MSKEYNDEILTLLKCVVDECEKEDRSVRERQLRSARKLKLIWENFTQIWYNEVAHDWRVWDTEQLDSTNQNYYDKPVNILRAYLESIIAALSVTVPPIKCFPDDAENVLDLDTARAGDKIAQLIQRHNDVNLLWIHSLFVYCTEGMVAAYNYSKNSKEYGTYKKKKYEDVEQGNELTVCSVCGNEIESRELEEQELSEFDPDEEDVNLHKRLNEGQDLCPACMSMMDPDIVREKFIVTRLVSVSDEPKSRVCLESYGLLNVKVPVYARKQCDCPYLIFSDEINYTQAMDEFELDKEETNDIIRKQVEARSAGAYDLYDQWARLSPQYRSEIPTNVVTRKFAWLRPCSFNFLNKEDAARLKKRFPDGAKVCIVNECVVKACPEALDDHWTLTVNPLSDYVHFDPIGLLLTSIQDITNDLISLILQTVEHGIGQTFADTDTLSFKAYEQTEVVPGGIFPAKARGNKSLGDGFFSVKTATLSQEVLPFFQSIQSQGQLVSGALPSLFGGQLQGSDTASEYSMSRSQALQRLQNIWKMFTSWWKNIHGKAIPMYIKGIQEDEKDVQLTPDGDFVNVFIKRAELEGKIGKIELEANENLPLTWAQIKDILMNLMNGQNPMFQQFLTAPENLPLLRDAIGLTDFFVPGEDDRNKQYDEIKILLQSGPMPNPAAMMPPPPPQPGMPPMPPPQPELPTVEIDPVFDNNQIHFEICRKWIISEVGRQAKIDNPEGYQNVLLHGKAHHDAMQPPPPPPMPPPPPGKLPPKMPSLKNAPVQGEENVARVQ